MLEMIIPVLSKASLCVLSLTCSLPTTVYALQDIKCCVKTRIVSVHEYLQRWGEKKKKRHNGSFKWLLGAESHV